MNRMMLPLAAIACLAIAPLAQAAQQMPYTPAAMQAAQNAGKPIVLHVTATWCSTCAAQAPIVMSLLNEPRYKDLVVLNVDFDKQKDALHTFDVRAQSTFVAFKGKREVARSTGVTDKASIEKLFDTTS